MLSRYQKLILALVLIVGGFFLIQSVPVGDLFSSPSPSATPNVVGWRSYSNATYGISLKYPIEFTLKAGQSDPRSQWQLSGLENGTEIFSLQILRSFQPRSNFVEATLRVLFSRDPGDVKDCLKLPSSRGYQNANSKRTIGGVVFNKWTRSEAEVGNFYEFTNYRALRNGGCQVIEYVIHDTSLSNYSEEARVKQYDKPLVQSVLESILYTIQFVK